MLCVHLSLQIWGWQVLFIYLFIYLLTYLLIYLLTYLWLHWVFVAACRLSLVA